MNFHDLHTWKTTDPPEVRWLIEGLLSREETLLLSGETGVGKSLFRTQLALQLIAGEDFLGYKIAPASVLIIQHENSINSEWRRCCQMAKEMPIPRRGLFQMFQGTFELPEALEHQRLEEILKASKAQVVIYDCLSTMHAVSENDSSQMRQVCECLKKIDRACATTSIMVHHHRKPSREALASGGLHDARGSSAITDYAGNIITIRKSSGYIVLSIEKTRDSGEEGKEIICLRDPETLKLAIATDQMIGAVYDLEKIRGVLAAGPIETLKKFKEALVEDQVADSERTAERMINWAIRNCHIYKFRTGNRNTYSLDNEYVTMCKTIQDCPSEEQLPTE